MMLKVYDNAALDARKESYATFKIDGAAKVRSH